MKPKEQGYVLSIDQASKIAGVSLWYSGDLLATTELKVSGTEKYSIRVQQQAKQLEAFLDLWVPLPFDIEKIVFENVRMKLVVITAGAFLTCPRIKARIHESESFIPSMSWKKWAKDRGATGPFKDIKGVKALYESGWTGVDITSDDIADSCLIYMTWRDKL